MTYEQKLYALMKLAPCELIMRNPGNWYVSQRVEVKTGSCLTGKYGNGESPETAVLNHWEILTDLPHDQYLVVNAYGENREAFIWNGFMWERVTEKKAA